MEDNLHRSRIFLLVIAIAVIGLIAFHDVTLNAYATDDIASDQCGTCDWIIDADGTLTISEGVLDYWEQEPPWIQYASQITRVEIDGEVVLQTGAYMFAHCKNLKYVNLDSLNTSSVEDFRYMFYECRNLESLDLSHFDTSSAISMHGMFDTCRAPVMDLSSFYTSNVQDMAFMFSDSRAKNLDLSSFDTSHVTNMEGMFSCYAGTVLDLSFIDFSSAEIIDGFLDANIYELKIGNWSQFPVRPSFAGVMHDKETGIDYGPGDIVPAVDGHHFVRCKRETGGYTITDISVDKDIAEWGDYVTVTIEYVGEAAPNETKISYYHSSPDERHDRVYDDYAAPFEKSFTLSYYFGTSNLVKEEFDKNTGRGTISLKTKIRSYALSGTYAITKVYLRNYASNPDYNPSDTAEFYKMAPIEVKAPSDNIVCDLAYNDDDILDALEGLKDGEDAIIRPQKIAKKDVPSAVFEGLKTYQSEYFLIKKEYYEAIQGKDVKLFIPTGENCLEIKAPNMSADLRDIYLPTTVGFSYSFGYNDDGNMTSYDVGIHCTNNGLMPSETTYKIRYQSVYDVFLKVWKETKQKGGTALYSKDKIKEFISSFKVYNLFNGELVKDASVTINGKWIDLTADYYSEFLLSDRYPKNLRSFVASISKGKFTYNGKIQKPSVKIKADKSWENNDYSVSYSNKNSKSVGKYSVTVKAKKPGFGSMELGYTIIPKGTSLTKVTGGKKSISVKWKKQSEKMSTSVITGYQIEASTNKSFTKNVTTKTIKGYKNISKKITGLKANKKYYVRVRTYKTVKGTKYYSAWSKSKTITTKK